MRRIIAIVAAVLMMGACGQGTKSEDEAVNDARTMIELTEPNDTTDEAVRRFLLEVCEKMDETRPELVGDGLKQAGYAPLAMYSILESASLGFCPEHREAVFDFTEV